MTIHQIAGHAPQAPRVAPIEADSYALGLRRAFSAAMPPKIPLSGAIPPDYSEAAERLKLATAAYLEFVENMVGHLADSSQHGKAELELELGDFIGYVRDNAGQLAGQIKISFEAAQEDARPKCRSAGFWAR